MFVPNKIGQPKSILILRALPPGDMLSAVPAFRALRGAFPNARITLISLPSALDFVKRFPEYLDDFIPFPGFPGFAEQPANVRLFPSFLNTVQKLHFDLAIQMHGPGILENSLLSLCGAKTNAGFYQPGFYCPDENLFLAYPVQEPEVGRHLRLMEFLGIPARDDQLEFPLFASDWGSLQRVREKFNLYKEYVCIHPAARHIDAWPSKNYAGIADGLAGFGYQVVLIGHPGDVDLAEMVAGETETRPVNLAGTLELGTLAALISQARLIVSDDTGMSSLAAAFQTPSIDLFSSVDAAKCIRPQLVQHAPTPTSSQVLIEAIRRLEKLQAFA